MSLVKRNDVLFPSLMNEIFKPDWFGGMENFGTNVPAVNIKEGEKEFEMELAVPGRSKEDFNIEIDDSLLSISSEVKSDKETKEDNYTRREFSYSSFKRSFTLPDSVDSDKIKATYEDGILKFTLPKKKEALPKPKRMISLS
ncbi:Hsp20/alpha crystallin family protein [Maribacter sp. MMG018]|uniref:Hsp20/alpha crystallin family protein n=1 Tax=Maribacter sp. MMG018 TaxID=2822688 RepID=UPI001B369908|nr:Hsp20/alpha crystallin family protein [Maribacter sp. MMG018]MBQ4914405.1 Hsp20/alpha crystallin family protein [Maribacter sp. MMG018]